MKTKSNPVQSLCSVVRRANDAFWSMSPERRVCGLTLVTVTAALVIGIVCTIWR